MASHRDGAADDPPWSWLSGTYPTAVPAAALAVIAVGAWWRRGAPSVAWRHATHWTVAGIAMATSPLVIVAGRTFTLPHVGLPLYEAVRLTERLGIVALIGLCLLTGLGFAACLRAVPSVRLRAVALAAAVLAGTWVEYRNGLG